MSDEKYKNSEMTLYLDMDGVLVDFEAGYSKIARGMGIKEFSATFGEKEARNNYLNAGTEFWANLNWIHGGKELWNASSLLFERVCILSSAGTTDPQKATTVEAGKREWLRKNIPSVSQDNVFIVRGKHLKQNLAARNAILVDDLPSTIQTWNLRGGFGILHNAKNYKNTIEALEDISQPIRLQELVKRMAS